MAIPLEQGRLEKIAKQRRRLERQATNTTRDVRRLLCKARLYAIEAESGNEDAREEMILALDAAIERGLSPGAIRIGGGMVNKINAIIDRPESQSHALGLLLNAADLLSDFDAAISADVLEIAGRIDNAKDHAVWREIATPRVVL